VESVDISSGWKDLTKPEWLGVGIGIGAFSIIIIIGIVWFIIVHIKKREE
jgi:hypothetical protein